MAVITVIITLLILIGAAVYFIARRRRSRGRGAGAWERRSPPLALSREDAVSQLFLTLATLFLAVTIFAFNRNAGGAFSWWSVCFFCTMIGFASAYSFKTPYTLALSLIALPLWWGARAAFWIDEGRLQAVAHFHRRRSHHAPLLRAGARSRRQPPRQAVLACV